MGERDYNNPVTTKAVYNTAPELVRQRQIVEQMNFISSKIDVLFEVINHLEGRLGDVMRPPQPKDETGNKAESLVILAEALHSKGLSIGEASDRITSILDRLEI